MFNYPYGQSQELNLTWLLNAWRQYQSQIENAIAPQYDEHIAYPDPVFLWYDHVLYTNPDPILDPEPFTPEHWDPISIWDILSN